MAFLVTCRGLGELRDRSIARPGDVLLAIVRDRGRRLAVARDGQVWQLARVDGDVASMLLANVGRVAWRDDLRNVVGGVPGNVGSAMTRLRPILTELGFTLESERGNGYVARVAEPRPRGEGASRPQRTRGQEPAVRSVDRTAGP